MVQIMPGAIGQSWLAPERSAEKWPSGLINIGRAAGPALLFGLRLWVAVCLALYVAFWLELDKAFWAGTSAAVVFQPHLGASLRKAWFRGIGTLAGAVVIVALTAWFSQNRAAFLIGLALWGGACAFAATLLRNFASYSAALAGLTAAVIANDELGAIGGPNGQAFTFAIARVSEILIGIACAGVILAGTDFGQAPRRLAARLAGLSADIANRFSATLALPDLTFLEMQPVRRELIRQIIALDPEIDEAIGESSELRIHSPILQKAMDGLFAAAASWRAVAVRLASLPVDAAREDAQTVLNAMPEKVRLALSEDNALTWTADPVGMRQLFNETLRELVAMPTDTPSLQLLADRTARVLGGLCHVLDGLALLSAKSPRSRPRSRFVVPDWLPPLINGGRAFVTIGVVTIFWIVTQWPSGTLAIVFATISVTALAPQAEQAYAWALDFTVGTGLAAVGAAVILLAGLPNVESFAGFVLVIGLYLVPAGALLSLQWQTAVLPPMAYYFVFLLQPANQMSYNSVQFYNSALAIIAGCGAAALSFRLLPPPSPGFRTHRLLALSLRDLRRIGAGAVERTLEDWEALMYSRLSALPDSAKPSQRAQLVTALSVGAEIIRLRHISAYPGFEIAFADVLDDLADGNIGDATDRLAALDRRLASFTQPPPDRSLAMRTRGRILFLHDALVQHQPYFEEGV
jgi:uncharacterized membrane protein YccC